jgi:hypothetical protein
LHEVITDQTKHVSLGEDGGFVVTRSIFEMEHEATRHARSSSDLSEVPVSDRHSIERAQDQKAVHDSLGMPNRYGRGDEQHRSEKHASCEEQRKGQPMSG